jgi:hypothetical protein
MAKGPARAQGIRVNALPSLLLYASLLGASASLSLSPARADDMLPAGDAKDGEGARAPLHLAQVTIEQRVIIRIPMRRPVAGRSANRESRALPPGPPIHWVEKKGPRCVSIQDVRGGSITSANGVDLMLDNHKRLRAVLGRQCRPEDLYSGFYIQPDEDGDLCAGRDRVQARSGASCEIMAIKRLEPQK